MNSTPNTRSTHSIKVVMLFAALVIGSECHAASFDCALASNRIDKVICASPKVSSLDGELAAAYKATLSKSSDPEAIKTAQRAWLKGTRNPCLDEACFVTVYQQRIAALSSAVATANANAQADADAEDQAIAKADVDAKVAADVDAAAQAQKVAEQAEFAASTAQAQKVAEQVAAAASATKAKEVADKAAADAQRSAEQQRLFLMAAGVAAICIVVALVGWLWLRRRSSVNNVKVTPRQPVHTNQPAHTPESVRVKAAQPVRPQEQTSVPIVKSSENKTPESTASLKQDEVKKSSQAFEGAMRTVFNLSSIIKVKAAEATKDLGEELGKINEARQQTLDENRESQDQSKVDTTKILAKSFLEKLTNKQKIISLVTLTLIIVFLVIFARAVLIAIFSLLAIGVIVSIFTGYIKLGSGIVSLIVLAVIAGVIIPGSPEGNGMEACEAAFIHHNEAKNAKIAYDSAYHKSIVNADGSVSSILNGYQELAESSNGGRILDQLSAYAERGSDNENGWHLWRCKSTKEDGKYKVTQLYMIGSSEADAFLARAK